MFCLQLGAGRGWRRWTFILGVCRDWMRGNGHKSQQEKFQLDSTKKMVSNWSRGPDILKYPPLEHS